MTVKKLDLAITGAWHACSAGNSANVLYSTVATSLSTADLWNGVSIHDDANGPRQVYRARVAELDGIIERNARITLLLDDVWRQACNSLKHACSRKLTVLLPELEAQDRNVIATWVRNNPAIDADSVAYVSVSDSLDGLFENANDELSTGSVDEWLVIAVDSLVDPACIARLEMNGNAEMQQAIVAGEAAVIIRLNSRPGISGKVPVLARISSANSRFEEYHGRADTMPMTALPEAVSYCCQQAGVAEHNIDSVVVAGTGSVQDMLEWSQVERRLWPQTTTEEQQLAMAAGEAVISELPESGVQVLRPYESLGNIGSAMLLLYIAISCARFSFVMPPAQLVVITATDNAHWRHAVLLEHPSAC